MGLGLLPGEGMQDVGPAIAAFWRWWDQGRVEVLEHFEGHGEATIVDALSARVDAIHPTLTWEFGPGRRRAHHLAVSAGGDPTLRVVAERWRSDAPADVDFEFYAARQRCSELTGSLRFGPTRLDMENFRVGVRVDESRQRFDLFVYHPAFSDVHEDEIPRMMWVVLDNALGEDAVQTWIGATEWVRIHPRDGEELRCWTLAQLREAVDDVASRWPEDSYVVAEAPDPETAERLIFTGCRSAKYLRHPTFDTLCLARLPYADRGDGMPNAQEKAQVDAFEDALLKALGDDVLCLCRSIGAGRRQIWMYLRAENGPARRTLEEHAAAHAGPVELRFSWDPGWRAYPL